MSDDAAGQSMIQIAAGLTIAWLGNPNTRVRPDEVPSFLNDIYVTVSALVASNTMAATPEEVAEPYVPAVTVRKSLASPDHIISMIDGKSYKTLRRHVASNGMTPVEYRQRYGLKPDYPMVAPAYSEERRKMARSFGLGRKPGQTNAAMAGAKLTPTARRRQGGEAAT